MPRINTAERFWVQVRRGDECWLWLGRCDEKGYGRLGFGGRAGQRAHRVAWLLVNGEIPAGQCVLHRCDNPSCVRPDHLFLGTQLANVADRDAKRRGVAPPSRAKLTVEQVRTIRAEYERGLVTQRALAERWGISRGNLSKILNRKAYVDA